ncbi:hypothetical protein [Bowmanella denitrificans]|uniref:hypothetical protein n=1 Tax=Bowmanella denitrificans TaxID=366582 RepID=UPI000C99CFE4|nr:hypothetical protein [Bowmanella denitrificans]
MFQVDALAKQRFKAPVVVRIPTEDIDSKGHTVYAYAHFVGLFECLPLPQVNEELDKLVQLQKEGKEREALAWADERIATYWVGFEKHPKHDFPFMDGDQQLANTPDNIKRLLQSKEVRDAVTQTYREAREGDPLAKNSRK